MASLSQKWNWAKRKLSGWPVPTAHFVPAASEGKMLRDRQSLSCPQSRRGPLGRAAGTRWAASRLQLLWGSCEASPRTGGSKSILRIRASYKDMLMGAIQIPPSSVWGCLVDDQGSGAPDDEGLIAGTAGKSSCRWMRSPTSCPPL